MVFITSYVTRLFVMTTVADSPAFFELMEQPIGRPPEDRPGPSAAPSTNQEHGNEILVNADDDDQWNEGDICRVCRFSGEESPLFHPCLCTGSIKYVHQTCLLEWLKYSKKDVCELCNHKFIFRPVYREDMPERLPIFEIAIGLLSIVKRYILLFMTYCLAFICWLAIVPLIASRVHRMVFADNILNSLSNLYSWNFTSIGFLFSPENMVADILRGYTIVAVFLSTFILLVFLREQIVNGGPPELFNLGNVPGEDAENQDAHAEEVVNNLQRQIERVDRDIAEINGNIAALEEERNNIANLAARVRNFLEHDFDVEPPEDIRELMEMDENQLQNYMGEGRRGQELNNVLDRMDDAEVPAPAPVVEQPQQPAAPVEAAAAAPGAEPGAPIVEEGENWGRDVERMVEDLTWQRLLGLDGSLVFIEHVIWMISLNVIFIILWMFFPCKLGELFLHLANINMKGIHFEPMINFTVGYMLVICSTVIAHRITRIFRVKDAYWLLGFFYLMMKVSLLIVLEIFVFPFFCGWWLDICSLPLTGSTLGSRLKALSDYPVGSLFVHWLVGMIDVFYSASFVLVLRELLRPGVLWFVRDLNDPEFQPIQEMIEQSFVRHFRRLIASTTLFFGIIFIMIYLPLRFVLMICPSVLPYSFSLSSESTLGEFSFELILLQFILPSILEQASATAFLKAFVIQWCKVVGGWFGLDEYLLPAHVLLDIPQDALPMIADAPAGANHDSDDDSDFEEAAEHQVRPVEVVRRELLRNEPDTFPKPKYFGFRILALLLALSLTGILFSFTLFVLPVTTGRTLVYLMLNSNANDLYTLSIGLYMAWLIIKAWIVARMWIQQGWGVFCSAAIWTGRVLIAVVPLGFIIPYMIGIYFQLLVVGPLRVAAHQTPLYFPFKDFAMGLVHFKLFCASVFVGPDWWLKAAFERLYEDGVRNYRLGFLYMQVVLPIITFISFLMCFPYVLAVILAIMFNLGYESKLTLIRYMYPSTVSIFLLCLFIAWQWAKLKKLANKIRNDKYLIGTQLVNFYRESHMKLK